MNSWRIKALYYGKTQTDRSWVANGLDKGLMLWSPYLGFLLQNGDENLLIDTGINDRMIVDGKAWGGCPAEGGTDFVLEALKKAGLKPKDIKTVIYTHLHNDHAGNCTLFPDARAIFQKDEYANLINPIPSQRIRQDYDMGTIEDLKKLMNIYMVDGDFELPNGLKLYKTPGHSLGGMSILVPTDDGPRIITGDSPHVLYNLFPQLDKQTLLDGSTVSITPAPESWGRYILNSLVYDHFAMYDSLDKLRLLAPEFIQKYYLCGHDAACLFNYPV
jgi:glyoxylase-like metal-dependent hydrolase (beta-lactamase superfamily II)